MNRVHMLVLLVSPLVASCSLLLTVETWCVTNETEAADTGFPIGSHIERQGGKWRLATPPGESGNPCADYTPRKNDGGAHARVDGGDVDADVNGGDAGSTTLPDASIDGGGCMCSGETPFCADTGACVQCLDSADCSDRDPCTLDRCSLGTCTYTAIPECVSRLDIGNAHVCVGRVGGRVTCWGGNRFGQLGSGTENEVPNLPRNVMSLVDVVDVVLGADFTCARRSTGSSCWGNGQHGQLGNGMVMSSSLPVPSMIPTDVTRMDAGHSHVCAVRGNGSVSCWGRNIFGELGSGSVDESSSVPVEVAGLTDVISVAASGASSCALRSDGTAACWGSNSGGQLGDGTTVQRGTPVNVVGISEAIQIDVGGQHSCALRADGTVVCWGDNTWGQLGDGTKVASLLPVEVHGLRDAVEIAASVRNTCARRASGAVVCWGDNSFGQLGDGTLLESVVPVEVTGLVGVIELDAGSSTTCARLDSGVVVCWGYNSVGQVGDGTRNNHSRPFEVPL